jgi:hypothetical protein
LVAKRNCGKKKSKDPGGQYGLKEKKMAKLKKGHDPGDPHARAAKIFYDDDVQMYKPPVGLSLSPLFPSREIQEALPLLSV